MASRSPDPNPPNAEVKEELKQEDSAATEHNATNASSPPAPTGAEGLTKKQLEIMSSIIHRITNYRDEE